MMKMFVWHGVSDGRVLLRSFRFEAHEEFLSTDVLPVGGPLYLAMSMIRRTYGRRAGAVRVMKREHFKLDHGDPQIFLVGQKKHRGEWRSMDKAPDLVTLLRLADTDKGATYTKQGS